MVIVATSSAATMATTIVSARRTGCLRRRGGGASVAGAASAAGGSDWGRGSSSKIHDVRAHPTGRLLHDNEHAAGFDRRPRRDGDVFHTAGARRPQFIFHLHGFDDGDRLPGAHLIAWRDE